MISWIRREPTLTRSIILTTVAVIATLVPDLDVDNVTGLVFAGLVLVTGVDLRGKVTPVE